MKKVLSVALASAMVLGMGVNAFADISYNTGVGDKEVDLKEIGLEFAGSLVIEDKDGVAIDTTAEDAEFRPGDVIYMPLYADDQLSWDVVGGKDATDGLEAVSGYRLDAGAEVNGEMEYKEGSNDKLIIDGLNDFTTQYDGEVRTWTNPRAYDANGERVTKYSERANIAYVLVDLKAEKGTEAEKPSDVETDGVRAWGPYTGEIGKNWSINFVEKSENFVEKASFYRAKKADSQLETNAWYIKVELKDLFDSVDSSEVYYKVYVADNTNKNTTNKVYVKGTFANDVVKYVDFEWTNNANTPAVWQVKKGENGTAVFDFQDKAFFTVKMYSEEKMYLDLSTAYQKAVANEYDAEFDNFFKFQGTNANFSRTGELVIESNDPNLFVYEIDSDNNLYPVDAKYVKDYQITHTNDKINGYVFNTKTLGNYVLSVDELEVEEETEAPEEKPADNTSSDKENPNTGANDFVGVAVALAVVSVAGAGALALKK